MVLGSFCFSGAYQDTESEGRNKTYLLDSAFSTIVIAKWKLFIVLVTSLVLYLFTLHALDLWTLLCTWSPVKFQSCNLRQGLDLQKIREKHLCHLLLFLHILDIFLFCPPGMGAEFRWRFLKECPRLVCFRTVWCCNTSPDWTGEQDIRYGQTLIFINVD